MANNTVNMKGKPVQPSSTVMSRVYELSARMVRSMLAARSGLQFNGARDLYKVYGYKNDPQWQDFWARYCRQDIASRVINAPVDSTWSPRPEIGGDAQRPQLDSDFDKLDKQINLWECIARADMLAGIGRYSCLFLGLDDTSDFSKPVSSGGSTTLKYVRALSEASAVPMTFDDDLSSERYGMPVMYEVGLSGMDIKGQRTVTNPNKQQIHYTRMLHIVEQPMENQVYGTPRLLNIWNLLDDLQKVVGGSAEVYWLTSNRGVQVDVDKDMTLSPDMMDALQDEVEEWQHELRRFVRTKGVKMTPLAAQYPNPTATFGMLLSLISGTTGIPQRILLGAEAGHLASDQDRANWADRIDDRRLRYAEPVILRPFLKMAKDYGFLRNSPGLQISWTSAYRMSPMEQDESLAQRARAAVNFSRQPQMGMTILSLEECRAALKVPEKPKPSDTFVNFPIPLAQGAVGAGPNANPKQETAGTQNPGKSGTGNKNTPPASGKSGQIGNESEPGTIIQ